MFKLKFKYTGCITEFVEVVILDHLNNVVKYYKTKQNESTVSFHKLKDGWHKVQLWVGYSISDLRINNLFEINIVNSKLCVIL